ncbi:MAG: hypothetical protein ACRDQA_27705, partial [Nocardioidaceae bacterium]
MIQTCQRCDRPVKDAHICTLCGRDLERALGNVPAIAADLEVAVAKLYRFTAANDGGRSAETPLPVNMAASIAASHLRATLVAWTRLVHDETGTDWPADNLPAISRYLLRHAAWLR